MRFSRDHDRTLTSFNRFGQQVCGAVARVGRRESRVTEFRGCFNHVDGADVKRDDSDSFALELDQNHQWAARSSRSWGNASALTVERRSCRYCRDVTTSRTFCALLLSILRDVMAEETDPRGRAGSWHPLYFATHTLSLATFATTAKSPVMSPHVQRQHCQNKQKTHRRRIRTILGLSLPVLINQTRPANAFSSTNPSTPHKTRHRNPTTPLGVYHKAEPSGRQ